MTARKKPPNLQFHDRIFVERLIDDLPILCRQQKNWSATCKLLGKIVTKALLIHCCWLLVTYIKLETHSNHLEPTEKSDWMGLFSRATERRKTGTILRARNRADFFLSFLSARRSSSHFLNVQLGRERIFCLVDLTAFEDAMLLLYQSTKQCTIQN